MVRGDPRDFDQAVLAAALDACGGALRVPHGRGREVIPRFGVVTIYASLDCAPQAIELAADVAEHMREAGID